MNKLFLISLLFLFGCTKVGITDADLALAKKYCEESGVNTIFKREDTLFESLVVVCKDGTKYNSF